MPPIYQFIPNNALGKPKPLLYYQNKVLLIVNTASRCGCTSQYLDLQYLYAKYRQNGLEILDFPSNQFDQAPENPLDYMRMCRAKFGTEFAIFEKIDVNGANTHPLYVYLKQQQPNDIFDEKDADFFDGLRKKGFQIPDGKGEIRWNFTKFLFSRNGELLARYSPCTSPLKLEKQIIQLL